MTLLQSGDVIRKECHKLQKTFEAESNNYGAVKKVKHCLSLFEVITIRKNIFLYFTSDKKLLILLPMCKLLSY